MNTADLFPHSRRSAELTPANDPRHSMAVLPRFLQPLLTALTGKPLPTETPLLTWTPLRRTLAILAIFALAILGSIGLAALGGAWLLLLPLTWLLTVYGARSIQTTIIHHGAHDKLLAKSGHMALLGELLSAATWILPFRAYKETHMEHHAKNATTHDVDLVFLAELGFRPGLTVRQYWRQLLRSIVSPRFHALYFRARMKANFVSACPLRATAAGVYTTALLAATWGHWGTLALAFLLPVFPLYHVAGLLQLLTEHNWVRVGENIKGQKALTVRRLTNARFMGEAAPALPATSLAGARAWLRWTFRMLFLHLPARLFVVQGDLPAHDLHHTKTDRNWAIAIHARRAAVLERPEHYYEIWGLATAILATFELLSRLPATAKLGEPLTYGEIADTYLSM